MGSRRFSRVDDKLGDYFDWIDKHNGVLLLAVTAVYVVLTWWIAKQGKEAAGDSARATKAAEKIATSAQDSAASTKAAAEASQESAAAAAATAQALASATEALRAMIPIQFDARAVGVTHRRFTLEIRCSVAAPLVRAVRIVRVAYLRPKGGLPIHRPLTEPITLEPTTADHELPRALHPGERLLASTDAFYAKVVDFVSVEVDYSFGSDEPVRTYRMPVDGFAGTAE